MSHASVGCAPLVTGKEGELAYYFAEHELTVISACTNGRMCTNTARGPMRRHSDADKCVLPPPQGAYSGSTRTLIQAALEQRSDATRVLIRTHSST